MDISEVQMEGAGVKQFGIQMWFWVCGAFVEYVYEWGAITVCHQKICKQIYL